ncbi:MAG: PTS glucose transporter subunit IIA [Anaerovibrio sp.]|nr:PTS glucose transporter subunit IIA [Selenomonadaceae bacterium]MDY6052573.1 PTS glucose transporter subunit IIA [Anaerovibrio sp.]
MSEGTHVISVFAPMNGKVIDLSEVPDQLYSKRILGDGVAIVPSEWEMYSPTDGYISVIADSKRGFGFTTDDGIELFVHIGMGDDDVSDFTVLHKKVGDRVQAGDLIAEFNKDMISALGFDITTPVVLCGGVEGKIFRPVIGEVEAGAGAIMTIEDDGTAAPAAEPAEPAPQQLEAKEQPAEPEAKQEKKVTADKGENETLAFLLDRRNWPKLIAGFVGITVFLVIVFVSIALFIGH